MGVSLNSLYQIINTTTKHSEWGLQQKQTPMTPTTTNKSCSSSSSQGSKGQSIQQRRLTRQKRLCYPNDQDVGESFNSTDVAVSFSLPTSPYRTSSDHWSTSAVPQPLPLPESPLTTRRPDHHVAALPFSRWSFNLIFFLLFNYLFN